MWFWYEIPVGTLLADDGSRLWQHCSWLCMFRPGEAITSQRMSWDGVWATVGNISIWGSEYIMTFSGAGRVGSTVIYFISPNISMALLSRSKYCVSPYKRLWKRAGNDHVTRRPLPLVAYTDILTFKFWRNSTNLPLSRAGRQVELKLNVPVSI